MLATPLMLAFGLTGVAFLLIPACIVAALLVRELPRFNEVRATAHRAHRERPGHNDWRGFSIMSVVVALRSTTFLAAVTFMPVFVLRVVHVNRVRAVLRALCAAERRRGRHDGSVDCSAIASIAAGLSRFRCS